MVFTPGSPQVVSAVGMTIVDGERYGARFVVRQPHGDTGELLTYRFDFAIAWSDGWRMLEVDVAQLEQ